MSGSGALRDLREAMSGSTALAGLVSAYAKETSYAKRTTQLDALLTAWVGTSTLQTTRDRATANGFTLIYMAPGQSMWDFLNGATTARQRTLMARQRRLVSLIAKLERLNGAPFVHISGSGVTLGNGTKVGLTSSSQDATQKYALDCAGRMAGGDYHGLAGGLSLRWPGYQAAGLTYGHRITRPRYPGPLSPVAR